MKYLAIVLMILVGLALLPDIKEVVLAEEMPVIKKIEPVVTTEPEIIQPVKHTEPVGCELVNKYDWNTTIAKAVCLAESRGDSQAVGDLRVIGGIYAPSYGLMQIRALEGRPNAEKLLDPEFNMQYAYELWSRQGWSPWSAYNNETYKKHLGE